jgi:signal transduction histidine kinase
MTKKKEIRVFMLLGVLTLLCTLGLLAVGGQPAQEPVANALPGLLLLVVLVTALVGCGWKVLRSTTAAPAAQSDEQMDFMYQMTHELQTPVSSIRLAADLLLSPAAEQEPGKRQKYLRVIQEECRRMQSQIENVLHIAQAEHHGLTLHPEPTPLNDLVQQVAQRYEGTLQADCQAQQAVARVDKAHLNQVLYNLLENAHKYSPDFPQIQLSTFNRNGSVVIAVRDNGVGIPAEEQQHIFRKFYRVPGNTNVKGFGLGLSYVQNIAQAHQWQIELDSEVGKGSEFRLVIPLAGER